MTYRHNLRGNGEPERSGIGRIGERRRVRSGGGSNGNPDSSLEQRATGGLKCFRGNHKPVQRSARTAARRPLPCREQAVEVTATFSFTIGATETVTAGSETLTMIYAQDQASISFPTETDDSTPATLTTQFWMAETEVTNAVVAAVFQWAYDNGRFSSTVSDPNGLIHTAKHGESAAS